MYRGFTPHTLYLADAQLAHDTVVGKAAIIAQSVGRGTMYLSGPHLEHPGYPAANTLIAELLYKSGSRRENPAPRRAEGPSCSPDTRNRLLRNIRSELSNSRIVALALERTSMQWRIGRKLYEPEKIGVFLEAMWSRWEVFLSQKSGHEPELYAIYDQAKEVTVLLRRIRQSAASGADDLAVAEELLDRLKVLTASFLTIYFDVRRSHLMNGGATSSVLSSAQDDQVREDARPQCVAYPEPYLGVAQASGDGGKRLGGVLEELASALITSRGRLESPIRPTPTLGSETATGPARDFTLAAPRAS